MATKEELKDKGKRPTEDAIRDFNGKKVTVEWIPEKSAYKLLRNCNKLLDTVVLVKDDDGFGFKALDDSRISMVTYHVKKDKCEVFDEGKIKLEVNLDTLIDSIEQGELNTITFEREQLTVQNTYKYTIPNKSDDPEPESDMIDTSGVEFTRAFKIPYHDLYEIGKRFLDISQDVTFELKDDTVILKAQNLNREVSTSYFIPKDKDTFESTYSLEFIRDFFHYSLRNMKVLISLAEDNPTKFKHPYGFFLLAPRKV